MNFKIFEIYICVCVCVYNTLTISMLCILPNAGIKHFTIIKIQYKPYEHRSFALTFLYFVFFIHGMLGLHTSFTQTLTQLMNRQITESV